MLSLTKKATLITLILSTIISFTSSAQFGNMSHQFRDMHKDYQNAKEKGKNIKSYLGYSAGIGMPFTTAKYEHRYTDIRYNYDGTIGSTNYGEKVITRNPKVSGIHITGNTYYTLAQLTENSILAFNFGAVGYILKYDLGEIRHDENIVYDYTMGSMQIGIPLCLDYKYGGEAIYNKSQKTSFTLGVGVAPIIYSNYFGPMINTRGDIRPFLRAEIGIFAGIEWRLTGSVLAGNSKIANFKSDHTNSMGTNATFSINSTPTYSVSLSFMPFSYDWESFGW